jgi:enoyl-CoA hydratase
MNLWLQQARPIFEAAVAMEFLGFTGPELPEGVAALREKRKPGFVPTSPV